MDERKDMRQIAKAKSIWLWRWSEPESVLTVIPRSKSARLAQQSKLANIDAEKAIARAYEAELFRTKAVVEAMFKSGKALRYSLISSGRQITLLFESARRKFEPRYRKN